MRQLLPVIVTSSDEVDPIEVYAADERPSPGDRPWVAVNMIASIDGATAVHGRSGALGGPADKQVFVALRAIADVVLVAAGTVRAENYGPPRPTAAVRAQRRARGQVEAPRIAIVTRAVDLDLDTPLFTEAEQRPYVIVPAASDPERRAAVAARAEVVVCGEEEVDLRGALAVLHRDGARVVLVEGGPSLNGALVVDDLVDEMCLTIGPALVAGSSARVAHAPDDVTTRLALHRILCDEDMLFLRYAR